jgi:hypothetical protein
MSLSRRLVLPLVLAATLAAPGAAVAACNLASACTFDQINSVPGCCGATTCTIDGTVTVVPPAPGAVCTFNFGTRDVTIAAGGRFVAGSNTVTILARNFTIDRGRLVAAGDATTQGGDVTIKTIAGFTLRDDPLVDLTGGGPGGGRLTVEAGGAVMIDEATVKADAIGDTTAGSITMMAGGGLSITKPVEMTANGGSGGTIDLFAGGDVLLEIGARIRTNLLSGGSGLAGTVSVSGATVTMKGVIEAIGGVGEVTLEARTGALVLDRKVQGINVDGSSETDAGSVDLHTLSITDAGAGTSGVVSLNAPISAVGSAEDIGGGEVNVSATGALEVGNVNAIRINVNGQGAATSDVTFSAIGDANLAAGSTIIGIDDPGTSVSITSGRDIHLRGEMKINGIGIFEAAEGGSLTADAARDLIVHAGTRLDATGSGSGDGGGIMMTAGRDLKVEGTQGSTAAANLLATAGSAGGGGGFIDLSAGFVDLAGNLDADGVLRAAGGGTISLEGCQVNVRGTLDTVGFLIGATELTAREGLHVFSGATIKADASNSVIHPINAAPVVDASPSPIISPQPLTLFPTVRCAQGGPLTNCLMPCPTCGNNTQEFPETCDAGAANHCDVDADGVGCFLCRQETCAGQPCVLGECDPNGGCLSDNVPDGSPCGPPTGPGDECNGLNTCEQGICHEGMGPTCECSCTDDGDPCTDEVCVNDACMHVAIPFCCTQDSDCTVGGQACSECNEAAETCQDIPDCCLTDADCTDGNPCTADTCDILQGMPSGTCSDIHLSLDGPEDGCPSGCTEDGEILPGMCSAGACMQYDPVPCASNDPCVDAVTDSSGCCILVPLENCCNGTPGECDDGDPCTPNDFCDLTQNTCVNEQTDPDCTACTDDADCDPFTPGPCGTSRCSQAHTCVPITPPDCNDGDVDTIDSCVVTSAGTAGCQHECRSNASCSDGDACNGLETRVACHCVPGPAPVCGGDDGCFDYGCDPLTGCFSTAKEGQAGVTCRLDAFEAAFATAPPNAVKKGARRKIIKSVQQIRKKLSASSRGNAKKQAKALKATGRQIGALARFVRRQRKLGSELLSTLADALAGATRAVEGLRSALGV